MFFIFDDHRLVLAENQHYRHLEYLRDETIPPSSDVIVGDDLEIGEYCAAFSINYQYFCKGIWSVDKLRRNRRVISKIGEFCPSYKHACITRGKVRNDDDGFIRERKEEHRKSLEETVGDLAFDDVLRKLEKIVPCRPNCDVQKFPHCTRRCKCKYELKRVRRWCGSPIEDHFEYFCRIWYMSCSAYISDLTSRNYHDSSYED